MISMYAYVQLQVQRFVEPRTDASRLVHAVSSQDTELVSTKSTQTKQYLSKEKRKKKKINSDS